MFIDDKDTHEHIHQYNLKHKMDKPEPATNLNNTLPPKRATLPPPNVKLLHIPQDSVQEDENIIDDIAAYFEENNITIDDDSPLHEDIDHNDDAVQQDLEPPVAAAVHVTLDNSSHTGHIPAIASNILLNRNHHDINYNSITSNHMTDNHNNENADTLAFPVISAVAIKLPITTPNTNEDSSQFHPCINDLNNVNHFYDRQE